ncbi:G-type lectin S-receptor serine/threonine-protein kinase RLK1 [Spatholobus suberectus]|nr:G-type lectin S-receptor serine/threonine-protein kinase RLK1 [Spatholobus suberectus]
MSVTILIICVTVILLPLLQLPYVSAQTQNNVSIGKTLVAGNGGAQWLSPSGEFAFGFRQLENGLFLLAIWYQNIPHDSFIWYANGDNPAPKGSKLELNEYSGLVLKSPQGVGLWTSQPISGTISYGLMNDTGNFQLLDKNSQVLWESFGNPTDTLVPTQIMEVKGTLSSRQKEANFSRGRFQFRLLEDGNAVLNPINLPTNYTYEAYYISVTYDPANKTNSGYRVIFDNSGFCWKKKLPLSNGRRDRAVGGSAFIKLMRNGVSSTSPPNPFIEDKKYEKDQGTLITVISVLLGGSVFVNFLLVSAVCIGFYFYYSKKSSTNKIVAESNLRSFTFGELVQATNNFKEELGRGSCGIVFKGTTDLATIAVKKLDKMLKDSDKEFKTEVNVIGQTHHKNLVRLLGYCDEGEHRILVYEFLSNGTLANFLFGDFKRNWNQRVQIAFGIARGLVYLHDECCTQIIHCDIKPQNILLDEHYNARISDFGLSKLLMINQSRTETGIRGTKGYVAPDWFRSAPITTKVDVYSFGVLLLEIICCRRNVDGEVGNEEKAILTDWAYDCYKAGRIDILVENDDEAISDINRLERFVMVAIWCLQEDPSLRPTMKKVMLMLEGIAPVTIPPSPCPYTSVSVSCG